MDQFPIGSFVRTGTAIVVIISLSVHFVKAGQPPHISTDIKCYERVAIGKRLNGTDIGTNITLATVRLCEQECERIMCQAFSFGITNGGNGTCELASTRPKAETIMDFDYDLFYKNPRCLNKTFAEDKRRSGQ